MKNILTLLAVIASFTTVFAQVTIDHNDFPRQASFTDTVYYSSQTGIIIPSEGAGQVWNYDTLAIEGVETIHHYDATADTVFPDPLNYFRNDRTFQGYSIPSTSFESMDSAGWYFSGGTTTDSSYSLEAVTGNPGDSLYFPGDTVIFNGRSDHIQFPLTYQSEWTQSFTEIFNFKVTAAALGMNKTNGFRKRMRTDHREVTGYGELTIPLADSTASASMDVLLVKETLAATDSFFLGPNGDPAPGSVLAAFGLTQGGTTTQSYYRFYRPGFPAPVMTLAFNNSGQVSTAYYRPSAATAPSGISPISYQNIESYPNPVQAGSSIHLRYPGQQIAGKVTLVDLQGRSVATQIFGAETENAIHLPVPTGVAAGVYIAVLEDEDGRIVGRKKLVVE